jgi:hypothetical protein
MLYLLKQKIGKRGEWKKIFYCKKNLIHLLPPKTEPNVNPIDGSISSEQMGTKAPVGG